MWLLDKLLDLFKNEFETKERSVNAEVKHFEKGEFSRNSSTTSSFHTSSEFIKRSCDNNNISNRCVKVNPPRRKQTVFQKNLCHICVITNHKSLKGQCKLYL